MEVVSGRMAAPKRAISPLKRAGVGARGALRCAIPQIRDAGRSRNVTGHGVTAACVTGLALRAQARLSSIR
jgi:hypothetical protein